MSTVMYAYRIKKEDFWEFFANTKAFYLRNDIVISKLLAKESLKEFYEVVELFKDDFNVTLQLFDFGDEWVFRVLERGYFFMNKLRDTVEQVYYDNRSDVPVEDEANEKIADEIDILIKKNQYFLVPIIDKDIVLSMWWAK